MLEQIKEIDQNLLLYLNKLGVPAWDEFWLIATEKWTSLPLYIILAVLIYKALGWKKLVLSLVLIALMITITDQSSNFSKDYFERPRPCNEDFMEAGRFIAKRCGNFGFFSAHAASTFALTTFIILLLKSSYRYLPFIMILWASIASYSRIYIGVHYPGDIVVGIIFGFITGWLIYLIYQKMSQLLFSKS
ncbi:MAG: phosphatase PAP2 family protein [Psychroflexus sp.]|nr:phosphatase PAP2 family protein [Psychroflexus sp.]MDR9447824.1 phosphatase PAP2 family protein [Psychroflexus sp.]